MLRELSPVLWIDGHRPRRVVDAAEIGTMRRHGRSTHSKRWPREPVQYLSFPA